jgi:hypothetical protein
MQHVIRRSPNSRVREQFDYLMQELRNGNLNRNSFRRWEAEIIVDLLAWKEQGPEASEILTRYQKSMHRRLAHGSLLPLRLSEYLEFSAKHARRGRAA